MLSLFGSRFREFSSGFAHFFAPAVLTSDLSAAKDAFVFSLTFDALFAGTFPPLCGVFSRCFGWRRFLPDRHTRGSLALTRRIGIPANVTRAPPLALAARPPRQWVQGVARVGHYRLRASRRHAAPPLRGRPSAIFTAAIERRSKVHDIYGTFVWI